MKFRAKSSTVVLNRNVDPESQDKYLAAEEPHSKPPQEAGGLSPDKRFQVESRTGGGGLGRLTRVAA